MRKVLICSSNAQRFFSGMSVLASKPGSLTRQENGAVLSTQNLTSALFTYFSQETQSKLRKPCTFCRKYCFAQKKIRLERIQPVSVLWTKFPAWRSECIFISDSKHSPRINHIAAARKCNIAPGWSRNCVAKFDRSTAWNVWISQVRCVHRAFTSDWNVTPGCSCDFGAKVKRIVTGNIWHYVFLRVCVKITTQETVVREWQTVKFTAFWSEGLEQFGFARFLFGFRKTII